MAKVIVDISMSLDGFVTAESAGPQHGLGIGGEPLHRWAMEHKTATDEQILASGYADTGAVIMGRRTFDVIDGPHGWSDDLGYGAVRDQSSPPPNVVVTHSVPKNPRHKSGFTYVTDGIEAALRAAHTLAAESNVRGDVVIMGGADVADQVLRRKLADELRIHLAPVILGAGTPFLQNLRPTDLTQESVITTPTATHLTYKIP